MSRQGKGLVRRFDRPRTGPEPESFARRFAEARGGSREALGELFELFRLYLTVVAQAEMDGRLRAKMTASDVVQQTFLRAHQALDEFSGQTEDEWRGWLRRILLNEIAQADRYFRHTAKRDMAREVALPDDEPSERGWQLPSPEESPSQYAIANENRTRLEAALDRLPADQRRVVDLRNSWMSFEQIGLSMGRSTAASQKLWMRAVERLKKDLVEPELS